MLTDEFSPRALATPRSGRDAMAAEDLGDAHVGNLKPEFESFALNPSVPPTGVLGSESEDQLSKLGIARVAATGWTEPVGGPLAADELAVPAEQCLRTWQQGRPSRFREQLTQTSEDHAITGLPSGFAHLALEDAELMAQSEDLGPKPDIRAGADEEQVSEEAEERIGEALKHKQILSSPWARSPGRWDG